jgi:ribonuclease HI
MMKKRFVMYTDGAARGNPVLRDRCCDLRRKGAVIKRSIVSGGETTNNQAEYSALLAGLEAALMLE